MFTKNAIIASAIVVSTFSISHAFADDTMIAPETTPVQVTIPTEENPDNIGGYQNMPMMNSMQYGQPGQYPQLEKMLSNSGVVAALQAAGIAVPTAEEVKKHHTAMEAARKAERELSDANKKGLESLRKTFRKQERDYLRSVGVAFPAESEIEKFQTIHETILNSKPATAVKNAVKKEVKKQMKKPAVKKMIRKEVKKQMSTPVEK